MRILSLALTCYRLKFASYLFNNTFAKEQTINYKNMKKTLDFNKLAKAHKAKKAWENLQKEQELETSDFDANETSSRRNAPSKQVRRKSS